jgi:hypothetical protein
MILDIPYSASLPVENETEYHKLISTPLLTNNIMPVDQHIVESSPDVDEIVALFASSSSSPSVAITSTVPSSSLLNPPLLLSTTTSITPPKGESFCVPSSTTISTTDQHHSVQQNMMQHHQKHNIKVKSYNQEVFSKDARDYCTKHAEELMLNPIEFNRRVTHVMIPGEKYFFESIISTADQTLKEMIDGIDSNHSQYIGIVKPPIDYVRHVIFTIINLSISNIITIYFS